jgi:hypothetical protein
VTRRLGRAVALAVAAAVVALALVSAPSAADASPQAGVTISGVDLHDGTIVKSGSTFYLYGTRYACGFQWGTPGTSWCGFGVATASSLSGPWSGITPLFSPTDVSPYAGMTWQQLCGNTGAGCFNPRMITRSGWGPNDGVPILWFNAPADFTRTGANAYYAMGCNSLTGPCGASAGGPYGSTTKPSLWSCWGNGDASIVYDNPRPPVMLCTMPDQTISSERLTVWGTSGVQGTGHAHLAGLTGVESPGSYRDTASGRWVLTVSEPNCGYCTATGLSYATAAVPEGPYTAPTNTGFDAPAWGRRMVSASSCGGQPRTVSVIDGQPYQVIDLWVGTRNETAASLRIEPLDYTNPPAAPGRVWTPFAGLTC